MMTLYVFDDYILDTGLYELRCVNQLVKLDRIGIFIFRLP